MDKDKIIRNIVQLLAKGSEKQLLFVYMLTYEVIKKPHPDSIINKIVLQLVN